MAVETLADTQDGPVTDSKTAAAALDLGSARILLASSEIEQTELTISILEQRGYDVITVGKSDDVVRGLEEYAIDIVVFDGAIEGGSAGPIEAIRGDRRYGDVPIILIGTVTGDIEGDSVPGIDVRIPRPVDPQVLTDNIRVSLRVRRSLLGMESAHAVVASLANELLAPETDVRLHTERLGTYAAQLGRRVGLSASDLNAVAYGTLLHDLAKLGIAEWILLKPGPFTEEERIAMQRHTEIGERIAAPLAGADHFGPILRHHHERWDGQGYPDGLSGESIPMGARIIGVVDAFDAMTQYRIYREAKSVPEAVEELKRGSGTQFDPALVDAFVEVLQWDGLI
jgi:putative two-component system response regulator